MASNFPKTLDRVCHYVNNKCNCKLPRCSAHLEKGISISSDSCEEALSLIQACAVLSCCAATEPIFGNGRGYGQTTKPVDIAFAGFQQKGNEKLTNGTLKGVITAILLAVLAACSASEEKVPKADLQQIFAKMAMLELENAAQNMTEGDEKDNAQKLLQDYKESGASLVAVDDYSCKEVATDTYDCSGTLALEFPKGTPSLDFEARVIWKDGQLKPIGPMKLGGREVQL